MHSFAGDPWALILAGGDGQRLGALTTNSGGLCTPKQYCSLDGGKSLLQLSIERALGVAPLERIVVVVADAHRRWWQPALAALPASNVIVQPCNRGTGLGILLSLLVIAKFDPAARITCLPSDHFVADEPVLIDALQTALFLEPGELDELIVLGVVPDAPDPGFGYLIPSTDLRAGLRAVRGFVEKPDPVAAASLIGAGGVWNTGIVVGSIAKVLDFYQPYVPGLVRRLRAIVDAWPEPALPSVGLSDLYSRHPAVDFSRDVLERQPWRLRLLTVPPCGWNDVGTPTRLATALSAQRNQVCTSDAATLNAETINLAAALAARTAMRGTGQPEVLQS